MALGGNTTATGVVTRRDRRGRRIGRNRWREYVVGEWSCADHAWWLDREAVAIGYATEEAEYAAEYPRPRLGEFMVALSAVWSGVEETAA